MKNINSFRRFSRNSNEPNTDREYVLYWMQVNRRFQYNYALEYAVAWANKLDKPLLIYEALSVDYPWACDRFHSYIMEGMKENLDYAKTNSINLFSYVETLAQSGKGLLYELAKKACLVVSDEYPVFITRKYNEKVGSTLDVPYITVDSNGIIPLGVTEKDPYSAYIFRKIMQKNFLEAYTNPPKENPLEDLQNTSKLEPGKVFLERFPNADELLEDIPGTISKLDINHSVKAIEIKGTREAALNRMREFIEKDLLDYGEKRNHPDEDKASKLSGWLHFGKISEYEIVSAALEKQPEGWEVYNVKPNGGQRYDFFGGNQSIESFLDEVITWREVGFHYAHHREDYDQFESLPNWAAQTLEKHKYDERAYLYTLKELEESKTHDELWNAAQTQLREEGIIHNYLRMLWGKKVIEWTPDFETALSYLIELNNKYAIDGCDPNSYSGIFWCFGRFDRAWQERDVFGKLRYMSSDNTRKKVKMKSYLDKYGSQKSLL